MRILPAGIILVALYGLFAGLFDKEYSFFLKTGLLLIAIDLFIFTYSETKGRW